VTGDQLNEFMALIKANTTKVSLEVRDVSYAVEAAGRKVALTISYLTLVVILCTVALALVAYSLKGWR
jgi:hypothetical protein